MDIKIKLTIHEYSCILNNCSVIHKLSRNLKKNRHSTPGSTFKQLYYKYNNIIWNYIIWKKNIYY